PDPTGVSRDTAGSAPADGDDDEVEVADPDAPRSIGSPGAAAAPFAGRVPSYRERRPAPGAPRLPTAGTACRCSADTTSVACRGHSSVCRTGSTLGALVPLSPASARCRLVADADHAIRLTGPSKSAAGGDSAAGQMGPGPPSAAITWRPASAHASIPPLTLIGSQPWWASSWATLAERPPALQTTYSVADRSISSSRAGTSPIGMCRAAAAWPRFHSSFSRTS